LSNDNQNIESRTVIIVATLNEAENLPTLMAKIREVLPKTKVIVVDDNSQDGTAEWGQAYQQRDPNFEFIIRVSHRGLGSATIDGFRAAIRRDAEWVGTLDADGSHDPRVLREMLDQIQAGELENVDVCIGSRYVKNGRIEGWPKKRLLASRAVNFVARWFVGLKAHDNTSALRLYRVAALREIDIDSITNLGYGYLQEILSVLQEKGSCFREFPITFRDRAKGKSKMSLAMALSVFWSLLRLSLRRVGKPFSR
jgi:dolichol-phosphate mannosyltransferase